MTIPHLLKLNAVLFAKLAGVAVTIACIMVSFKFAYRLTEFLEGRTRYVPAAIVALMLSSFSATSVHAVSGMETALFTLLITSFLYFGTILADQPTKPTVILLVLIGLLLGLTRPEGNLVVIVGLSSSLMMIPRQRKSFFIKTILLLYILPGLLYFLWRVTYYGHFLPLPFYVKVPSQPFSGMRTVISFAQFMGVHVGIPGLLGLLTFRFNSRLLPAFLSVASLVVFFMFPVHIMGYKWRYLFPVVPFIFVIAGVGIGVLYSWIQPSDKGSRPFPGSSFCPVAQGRPLSRLVFYGICLLICVGILAGAPRDIRQMRGYSSGLSAAHIALGRYLRSFRSTERSPLVAIGDAGAVPYYSQWRTIDTYGLNDASIALSRKHDPEYVLSQKPDLVVLISMGGESFEPRLDWEQDLYESCLQAGMVNTKTLVFNPQNYYLWIMAAPKSSVADYISEWE